MPFKSESQRRYLYAKEPEVAEEFERHTPKGKKLSKKKPPKKGQTYKRLVTGKDQ
jgi:hypothetical protein